jgi:hypothetical protein
VPTRLASTNFGLGSANFDLLAPIKARAYDALQAVLKSRSRPLRSDPPLMHRGVERC